MKKLFGLVESLAELPDAIHAILESHHENVERRIEERCNALGRDIAGLMSENSILQFQNSCSQKKITELELYKSRDIESRRWRKQSEESCPLKGSEWVMYRDYGSDESLSCLAKYLMPGNEWRYVSPEDMP
jgi:hypothetical protein